MCKWKMNRHLICYILHVPPQTNKDIHSVYNFVCLSFKHRCKWLNYHLNNGWIDVERKFCYSTWKIYTTTHQRPSQPPQPTIVFTYDWKWWMFSTWIIIIICVRYEKEMNPQLMTSNGKCTVDKPIQCWFRSHIIRRTQSRALILQHSIQVYSTLNI